MEWAKLLSTEKLSSEPPEPDSFKEYPINAFEKDYSRIVSSAAFRRLQDKTQVFPLDKSDFIRTRLTHSIEVSTIARQLGIMISKLILPCRRMPKPSHQSCSAPAFCTTSAIRPSGISARP